MLFFKVRYAICREIYVYGTIWGRIYICIMVHIYEFYGVHNDLCIQILQEYEIGDLLEGILGFDKLHLSIYLWYREGGCLLGEHYGR